MSNDMTALDRRTLRFWRASNWVGWGLIAASLGLLVQAGVFTLVSKIYAASGGFQRAVSSPWTARMTQVFVALAVGVTIASVVVLKSWSQHLRVAVLTALTFLIASYWLEGTIPWGTEFYGPTGPGGASVPVPQVLLAVLVIPVALFATRLAVRRTKL